MPSRARTSSLLRPIGFLVLAGIAASAVDGNAASQVNQLLTVSSAAKGARSGLATYYGKGFHGKETANGEVFNKHELVAAHPTYPMGTQVRVTNLRNGRTVNVRIVDRGPTPKQQAQGVIIDLSEKAAVELGFRHQGKTRVKTEVVEWGGSKRAGTSQKALVMTSNP